jgi:hypothetical protein
LRFGEIARGVSEKGNTALVALKSGRRKVFCDESEELQSFLGESSAGGSFEVALEKDGLARVGEGLGGFDPPRTQLGGVRRFPGIVPLEPVMQIVSMTDIMVFGLVYTLKDIDI